ncbi:MAG: hypothetical protein LBO09_00530 [Candidatus Peribacteria bacterium]|nr:hypothetical protein [Candidatus Peribacteria bacterium]
MVGLNEFTGTTGFTVDTIPVGKYTITLSANGTTYTTTLANGVCSNTYSNYPTC